MDVKSKNRSFWSNWFH